MPRNTCTSREQSIKQVLYFGGQPAQFRALVDGLAAQSNHRLCASANSSSDGSPLICWNSKAHKGQVVRHLEREFVNLMVLDLRCAGDARDFARRKESILEILSALDEMGDVEARYGFHRILLLVSGSDSEQVDQAIVEVGLRGVGSVLRQSFARSSDGTCPTDAAFAARVIARSEALIFAGHRGHRALCAAGGGITGIYFEMGALKCLDDCLATDAINSFDMYFGISAGAIVVGLLSAGYSVDELMAAVHGVKGMRLAPLDMRVFRLGHVDYPSLGGRLQTAAKIAWKSFWGALRRPSVPSLDRLLFDYSDVVGPPFRARGFGKVLESALTAPGTINDFRLLPHKLYIGATEQDAREHVLFGSEGHDEVPISTAIEASMSLNPAFGSTPIQGHFYEDGAVTRTSNFSEAIRRGAGLVFTIDPFVPYVSRDRGFARDRGMLYNIDQNIRTMSYTRFENTRSWILRQHPDVSSYTFVPANRLRRLLSISPFDHRPYLEIWRGAYLSTLQRVHRIAHRLQGDVKVHGLSFDTALADAVAERLSASKDVAFDDFFLDRKVRIKQVPLKNTPARVCA
ncbi:MAG: patatin-like phospholipase family protein [Deltaproteobacteria bacterium]|nr:patatin-like phospholipase family protein [Deltaproteobacteria bacterium]